MNMNNCSRSDRREKKLSLEITDFFLWRNILETYFISAKKKKNQIKIETLFDWNHNKRKAAIPANHMHYPLHAPVKPQTHECKSVYN